MLYELPKKDLGLTHADLHLEVRPGVSIFIRGPYGKLNKDGEFEEETRVSRIERVISGPELEAFLAVPIAKGLPKSKVGNFRFDDLTAWLDKYGYSRETKTWVDPKPSAKRSGA